MDEDEEYEESEAAGGGTVTNTCKFGSSDDGNIVCLLVASIRWITRNDANDPYGPGLR